MSDLLGATVELVSISEGEIAARKNDLEDLRTDLRNAGAEVVEEFAEGRHSERPVGHLPH